MERIPQGINQRDLDRLWREHGGVIQSVHSSGERRYVFPPTGASSGKYNARTKNATRSLVTFVRKTLEGYYATHTA